MGEQSNIVIAVDAELAVLERRVEALREIRRLAVDLEKARLPRAAGPAEESPPPPRPSRGPGLQPQDAVAAARDLLADGPVTVSAVLISLGRSQTRRAREIVQSALEELGAGVCGHSARGAELWTIPSSETKRIAEPEPAPAEPVDVDPSELSLRISDLAERAVGWSPEEYRYQLRKRFHVEASVDDVREVLDSLNGAVR